MVARRHVLWGCPGAVLQDKRKRPCSPERVDSMSPVEDDVISLQPPLDLPVDRQPTVAVTVLEKGEDSPAC